MIVLNTDLDNTIIYSYKHDLGRLKRSVEIYQGREISFITERTYELLQQVSKHMLIVPTSTRTIEQYKRIDLGIGEFQYALVCNGGILLWNGKSDDEWYQESLRLIEESRIEIEKSLVLLENEGKRTFEVRFVNELFVFTKCEDPEDVVSGLREQLNTKLVDIFNNGAKVYVVPKKLSKGNAIERLRKRIKPEYIIAAGDSEFDISMVMAANQGIVPYGFKKQYNITKDIVEMSNLEIFSEALLEECLKIASLL